jgi:hypothetical protein
MWILPKLKHAPLFLLLFFLIRTSCFAFTLEPYLKETPHKSVNSLNLVFCPLNYQDSEDFLDDMQALSQELKRIKPFDEFDNISLKYIDISANEEQEIFQANAGLPPFKVRMDLLEYISAQLKASYKLIIIDASSSVYCAELSSAGETSLVFLGKARYRNSIDFVKGFLHELGHSLGLRDECVNCQELNTAGEPNCAKTKEEAQKWWGNLAEKNPRVRYINGCCGNHSYTRPTIASLMNDIKKADDFGPVNERYLRKELTDIKEK